MNSPQNGILLSSISHVLFSVHYLAVNPEADYRVYVFDHDNFGYHGNHMSIAARENGDTGVRDALLSWHFRQCVLANMRGAGEPTWDYGPNEGGDVVGRLLSSDHVSPDQAMARLGEEVGARLALTSYPSSEDDK
ncbi:hypothetical protein TWF506_004113 [Arthrobotrys conoides]|uniref:HNH nuclease domain-containing protein n=1 Tax=Arthrobotrys conoides TaxID=74498 RepID=A0AAN8NKU4_9PEZI